MARFILRNTGSDLSAGALAERLRSAGGVTVIDAMAKMLLIDAPRDVIDHVLEGLSGWLVTPEQMIERPEPRPKVRR